MKSTLLFLRVLLIFIFCCLSDLINAQDFPFAVIDQAAMDMRSYPKDKDAVAVVLKEFGTARISNNDDNNLIFEYHVQIKVFNSQKFTRGNIEIPLHKQSAEKYETVKNIEAVVYNQDKDGTIQRTDLNPKNIFKENKSKYTDLVKFAMPGLRDGSVIEYKYRLESPFIFNFRPWEFQWDIPKIYSEYVAYIPAAYNYNVSLVGPYKLTKRNAEILKDCFEPGGGYKADCSVMTYGMSDIPAFVEEDFMTAPKNYLSAIKFELAEIALYGGNKRKITQEWKDIDYELKQHELFGKQIRKNDLFKDRLPVILENTKNDLEKAQAIYDYIQKWFKWNNYVGIYSEDGIKKALEKRTGNVGDINLSLVAALKAAKLECEAVVLSTRDNGLVSKLYPVISDFNYVIARVNIAGKSYLLDATDHLIPFGLLPLRCINGQGRAMSINKASYWIDLVASQKRTNIYNLDLALQESGKIRGSVLLYFTGYEAYNRRKAIKKFNTVEEYVEDLDENMLRIKILSHKIQNLDSIQNLLSERYEIEMDAFDNLNKDRFYFNPYFMDKIKNPFKLVQRTYPVDLGAPIDSRITISLSFPPGYEIVSKPMDKGIALPNNGGRYISNVQISGNTLKLSEFMGLERSIYHAAEYPYLKEFYNQIIQLQKTNILFEKKL